jgi:type VI protein secretion system component Hcp
MASQFQLTIPGIEGDGPDGTIEVWSANVSVSNHSDADRGGPGAGGDSTCDMSDMHFIGPLCKSWAKVKDACCKGTHFKEGVELKCIQSDGNDGVEFIKIKLDGVAISNSSINLSGGESGRPNITHQFSLKFGKIGIDHTGQDDDGNKTAAVTMTHDLRKRKAA